MPKLIRLGFEREEFEYELELNWDDKAFVENAIKFGITARRKHKAENEWYEHSVSLSLEEDEELGPVICISTDNFNDKFPLNGLVEESEFIDWLPAHVFGAGDPITGCLIRSGLSTTIGQIISCRNETAAIKWFIQRAKAICFCVKDNIPAMTGKMALRATLCIVKGGF